MLAFSPIIAFVSATDRARARDFYETRLGLRLVSDDHFALVFDASGTMLRVTMVEQMTPEPYTVLGWKVADINSAVADLCARGVPFQRYDWMPADSPPIWTSPSGARIAWFTDPDGNILSITQF